MNYASYFTRARQAASDITGLGEALINTVLLDLATAITEKAGYIIQENGKDLERMNPADEKYDRLQLTEARIKGMATEIRHVAALDSPVGEVLLQKTMPNGMDISKLRVPLGVVAVIYEARPNVTLDVFSLCFKTGNVALLKGSGDAADSNKALAGIVHDVLKQHGVNPDAATLLPPEREATDALLQATAFIDVVIPRGSQGLINFVRAHSKVPVIETGAGIVHVYGDASADIKMLGEIVFNSKTRRPSVCNSLDCLLVHQQLLPAIYTALSSLADKGVILFADEQSFAALQGQYPAALLHPASPEHYGTEFLSLKMAVKTVASLEEALSHIETHSSKHSEAIVSETPAHIEQFLNKVDAAAVYANAATSFTDGAQFGLGAEIGISTQKLHARGPMGLEELTSYKWVVRGTGQVRV